MNSIYPISEVQAKLSKLCKDGNRFVISNRNRPVMVALPIEEFDALMETLDVLSDPKAMKEIQRAEAGKGSYKPLDLDHEDFGL
ncbi:MAG: type II toxin-antitoxin system Phd/YefM family antitoxin [Verrucomicrobia bacterium]|nr:type II toxin-antitoxin system Phd/YefM family antitoxin [Verrucomicrobiota bacterium]MCH8513912.1 type II toxin-antitoxin system Phd/YefM family antitoxin [Kiritimatiellia bacterium]